MLRISRKVQTLALSNPHIRGVVLEATTPGKASDLVSRLELRQERNKIRTSTKCLKSLDLVQEHEKTTESQKPNQSKQFNVIIPQKTSKLDLTLMDLLKLKDTERLAEKLVYFENLQCFPSRKSLLILASAFAKKGELDNIKHVQRICLEIYPKEFDWLMGYRHYEAEAMWKNGEIEKSVYLFQDLFKTYTEIDRRKKISEMTAFLMRHVFTKSLREYYGLLEQFSNACLKEDFFLAAVYLWSISFTSNDHHAWSLCDKLFDVFPDLKNHVVVKFNFVIKTAQENRSTEMLQRLIEFILKHNLDEYLRICLGKLLILQCDNETVTTALETFHYASKMKIQLPAESTKCLCNLLLQHKHEIPLSLLRLKYFKKRPPSSINVHW